jgi:hypothetical protein
MRRSSSTASQTEFANRNKSERMICGSVAAVAQRPFSFLRQWPRACTQPGGPGASAVASSIWPGRFGQASNCVLLLLRAIPVALCRARIVWSGGDRSRFFVMRYCCCRYVCFGVFPQLCILETLIAVSARQRCTIEIRRAVSVPGIGQTLFSGIQIRRDASLHGGLERIPAPLGERPRALCSLVSSIRPFLLVSFRRSLCRGLLGVLLRF